MLLPTHRAGYALPHPLAVSPTSRFLFGWHRDPLSWCNWGLVGLCASAVVSTAHQLAVAIGGVHRSEGILANLHVSGSINNLVRLVYPRPKGSKCLLPHHLSRWNPALRVGQSHFPVDERVIENDLGGVARGVSEIHVREATPVDGTEAHGAGFARGVQFAIQQLKIA